MSDLLIHVSNMHCETCVEAISKTVRELFEGSTVGVSVDLGSGNVKLSAPELPKDQDPFSQELLQSVVFELKNIGFTIDNISTEVSPFADSNALPRDSAANSLWGEITAERTPTNENSSASSLLALKKLEHEKVCDFCSHETSADGTQPTGDIENRASGSGNKYELVASIDGITCAACASTIKGITEPLWFIDEVYIDVVLKSGKFVLNNCDPANVEELTETVEDAGYDFNVVEELKETTKFGRETSPQRGIDSKSEETQPSLYRVTAMIDGITCAACVSTINSLVKDLSFVEESSISAVSKVGVFLMKVGESGDHTQQVEELKESVEDAGYDFEVMEDEPLKTHVRAGPKQRTVELLIKGIHCDHCPQRVVEKLSAFGQPGEFHMIGVKPGKGNIKNIDKSSASHEQLKQGSIKITYTPDAAKKVTIRHIIEVLQRDLKLQGEILERESMSEHVQKMAEMELRKIVKRLLVTCVFVVPTFIFGVITMSLLPSHSGFAQAMSKRVVGNTDRNAWVLFGVSTPVYFFVDGMFHTKALKELRVIWKVRGQWSRKLFKFGSMNLLICLGTSVSYFASILLLIISSVSKESSEMTKTYFDSVVFLTFFILIGKLLESVSKSKTSMFLNELSEMKPTTAILYTSDGDDVREVSSDDEDGEHTDSDSVVKIQYLEVGDLILIKPGESPPLDCVLKRTGGHESAQFDESCLTGESVPQSKSLGDVLYSGTINTGTNFVVGQVITLDGDSLLDSIVSSIREGQLQKRAPIEVIADKITSFFVPCIVLLALITWVVWISLGYSGALPREYLKKSGASDGGWAIWSMEFAISVFVISCPCALGLSVPLALFVGTGMVAKYGILAKGGGQAFEKGSKVNVVCFDKTGTLTMGGDLKITNFSFTKNTSSTAFNSLNDLIMEIYQMEKMSNHPLSKGVLKFIESEYASVLKTYTKSPDNSTNIQEIPGRGLKSDNLILGNEKFMNENHCFLNSIQLSKLSTWKTQGKSVILAAAKTSSTTNKDKDKYKLVAAFAARDEIRPESKQVVSILQERGVECWIISGDNETTTRAIGKEVGITNVIAEVLPDGKAEKILWIKNHPTTTTPPHTGNSLISRWFTRRSSPKTPVVCMVGDGVNDAPALSVADVGVAIATKNQASDLAISSCDFAVLNHTNTLESVLILFDLCSKIFRRVHFNFAYAIVYNSIGVPIAAGVLFGLPSHYRLSPTWSSLIMAVSSVSVVLSSLQMKFYKPRQIATGPTSAGGDAPPSPSSTNPVEEYFI